MNKPSWIDEFKEFIMRGNVLDLAVGVVIGGAFTSIVNSIVADLITPIIGLAMGNLDFSNWVVAGFGVGNVINAIISFLITAFVVFWLVKTVNRMMPKKEEEPAPEEPAGPTTEELLSEIRDLLKEQQGK